MKENKTIKHTNLENKEKAKREGKKKQKKKGEDTKNRITKKKYIR